MREQRIGVIINGATGRMGTTQHMANLLAIASEGGLALRNGDRLIPDLLLVGRDAGRLKALAAVHGNLRWTTSLDEALRGPDAIFMDCAATGDRPARVHQAIAAGKHIHTEKPTAPTVEEAMALARAAHAADVKHGVIQDKLFLPGFAKLLFVKNSGFLGRILSIRIDAGSWIFDGKTQQCQRPSWNYQRAEGGGIALDMMAHWRYMIDRLAAPVTGVCALMATAIPERVDEQGLTYTVDAEDTSHALLQLAGGAVGVITNSWATRHPARRHDGGADRRHVGICGGRTLPLLHPGGGEHARSVLRCGASGRDGFGGAVAGGSGHVADRQSLPAVLGGVPAPCRRGCALRSYSRGRCKGRAACRSCLSQRRGGPMDDGAGTQCVKSGCKRSLAPE